MGDGGWEMRVLGGGGVIVRAGDTVFVGVIVFLFVMMLVFASFVTFFTSAYAKHCGGSDDGDECISEIHGCILLSVNVQS